MKTPRTDALEDAVKSIQFFDKQHASRIDALERAVAAGIKARQVNTGRINDQSVRLDALNIGALKRRIDALDIDALEAKRRIDALDIDALEARLQFRLDALEADDIDALEARLQVLESQAVVEAVVEGDGADVAPNSGKTRASTCNDWLMSPESCNGKMNALGKRLDALNRDIHAHLKTDGKAVEEGLNKLTADVQLLARGWEAMDEDQTDADAVVELLRKQADAHAVCIQKLNQVASRLGYGGIIE